MTRGTGQSVLICVAVDAHLLEAGDVATLREQAEQAVAGGAAAVFVTESSLGDPFVLVAGLATAVPGTWLGARTSLSGESRHPAMLAREMTSLDLVCGGRSVLCFGPPFDDPLAEAISLCRALWRDGEVSSDGPRFPVHAARNRARPLGRGDQSPLVALDLSGGETFPNPLGERVDLVLHATPDPRVCVMERV